MKKIFLFSFLFGLSQILFSQILFQDDFESNNSNENPPFGWICDANGWLSGEGVQSHGREPHGGDWYAYLNWDSDHWMYKEVELAAGESYQFSVWYKTDGIDVFFMEIKWGTAPNPGSMQNELFPLTELNNDTYLEFSDSFICESSGVYYIGIHGIADNSPWYLMLDDVQLSTIADYAFTTSRLNADTLIYSGESHDYFVEIENIGLNEDQILLDLDFNWPCEFYNSNGSGPINSVNLQPDEVKTLILRQTVPASGVFFGEQSTTTATFTSENSANSSQLLMISTTLTPYQDFPLIEGFEGELFPPLGWLASIENGSRNFERSTLGEYPTCVPHDNSEAMAYYNSFSAQDGHSALLVSPQLALQNQEYIVRFWFYRTDNIENKADKIEIYLSDDMELNSADLLGTIHRNTSLAPVETYNGWFEYSFVFNGNDNFKYIIFRAVSSYGWNMYLDDITIKENLPDVDAPEFISINELTQYADLDLPIEIVIRDESEVTEIMQGIFDVGNGEEYFELNLGGKSKGNHAYFGNIPAQLDQTSGTVKFIMEDIYGNSAETDEFEINWTGIAPLLEESFEDEFLPNGWTQIMQPYTWFVWSKVNEEDYTDSDGLEYVVTPPDGEYQAMVGWDFQENHQDEWLISPEVEITDLADLTFETFARLGSHDYDHFVVAISTNGGASWVEKWDAFYFNPRVIEYDETIQIPLDEYLGQNIKVAWRAYNQLYDNIWYSWFIDDVKIEKRTNVFISDNLDNSCFDVVFMENPFDQHLNIQIQNASQGFANIKIIDITGKLVYEQELETISGNTSVSLPTSNLQNGAYIFLISHKGCQISKKVMKMK